MREVKLELNAVNEVQESFNKFIAKLKRNQRKGVIEDSYINEQKGQLSLAAIDYSPSDDEIQLIFVKSLILDLLLQGWNISSKKGEFYLKQSLVDDNLSIEQVKEKIRNSHLLARNSQLLERSVTDFIQKMERRKFTEKGWVSIFSLMRDGKKLKDALEQSETKAEISNCIKPYVQFVEPGLKCEHTSLNLSEIWRYFRHTWITEYKSLPGRSILILIRDAAAEFHPVIGIAALGSSMSQLTKRDSWIGWESETFVSELINNPNEGKLHWLIARQKELQNEIYIEDLKQDGLIAETDLEKPTIELIKVLKEYSEEEKVLHRRFPQESKKNAANETIDWEGKARTHLFKSKRCSALADLLNIRLLFNKYGLSRGKESLEKALEYTEFRNAVGRLVRKWKGQRVGIDIMDIIVCGSIAPYNTLLGGKLVCLLLTSPEVIDYYNHKYSRRESVIASSMAGKPIVRKPKLSFLATTSLYGIGSSQYNRIKLPLSFFEEQNKGKVEYINFGVSEGFGSFHFSKETIRIADVYLGRRTGGKRVNSIFGEGANPLIRKLRESIELLGLESEPLLKHENKRIIYGIPLAKNTKEILLGYEESPDYLIPGGGIESTEMIAKFWKERWLAKRILRPEVLERLKKDVKAYPVTHGARVPLYKLIEENGGLFDDF